MNDFYCRRVNYVSTNNVKIIIVVPPYDKCRFKKRNIVLIVTMIVFNHLLGLLKYVLVFLYLRVFPARVVILLSSLLQAS